MTRTALAALALSGLAACSDEPAGGSEPAPPEDAHALFTDVTARSGLDLVLTAGGAEPTEIVEVKGGGIGLVDVDGDGDLDVFAPNGSTVADAAAGRPGAGARLFANDGDLRFHDATAEAALDWRGWGMGVAAGDVDGDGWTDLFVSAFGADALFANEAGKLVERAAERGLGDDGWGTGCALADLDADGDLDLYLVRYLSFDAAHPPAPTRFLGVEVFDGPAGLPPLADRAYENDGDGAFRDATAAWGFDAAKPSYGLGCVALDLDDDGRQDVYVGNDSMPNFLWRGRDAEPRFVDAALEAGVAVNADGEAQATMGLAFGDVNGDGRADLFSTNFMTDTNTLFESTPTGAFFADRTQRRGLAMVSRPFLGWAAWFGDLDLDGDEDLVSFNGHVYPTAAVRALGTEARQEPLCFLREDERFRRLLPDEGGAWLAAKHADRSAAFADLDGDGDLDAVVAERAGPVRVLRGEAAGRDGARAGFTVRLRDAREGSKNPRGIGAKVTLLAEGARADGPDGADIPGEPVATRWIVAGGSYLAACPPEVHLSATEARAMTLEVRWPDGFVQRVPVDPVGFEGDDHTLSVVRR